MAQIEIVWRPDGYSLYAKDFPVETTSHDNLEDGKKWILRHMNDYASEMCLPPFIESDLEFIDNTK